MKASDLRIGNYVAQGEIIRIDKTRVVVYDKGTRIFVLNKLLKPIPLTEEILLKCGFEKINNDYPFKFIKNKGMSYEVEIENLNSTTCFTFSHGRKFSLVRIDYLHQLQDLYYALTRQELEIKL